ncbi:MULTISPECIES: MGMT family protein [Alkalimonas]|uniref:MGMT family protein n=1 Tax=Alkalimonas mucilaginosa TaxID=3057676 RepID=A0ABU7JJZ5_9GAMM|nr:MGMT family protein [Alkalimonas sp. MEB004]MEE2026022.1 MGMT family protein [Alkalimonas sp. MEB004]
MLLNKTVSQSYYQQIWYTVQQIPAGKVASYGQIADLAGLPGRARLVGKALGAAPKELALPWYRVLRSDRSLAFAAGSDTAKQQRQLLQQEGVLLKNNRVRKDDLWQPDLMDLLFRLKY